MELRGDYSSVVGRFKNQGVELVTVIGPSDKDDPCLDWVGAVLSLTGQYPGVPTLAQAIEDGLFHPGCRHTLVAFNPRTATDRRIYEAEVRTRHAMAAKAARLRGEKPPYLPARQQLLDEQRRLGLAPQQGMVATQRLKFQRVYEAARKADAAGDNAMALLKCRAALELLKEADLFGSAQEKLMRAIETRIYELDPRLEIKERV